MQEVIEMESSQIEAAPHIGSRLNTDFIKGIGTHDNRFIIILDIDKVFSNYSALSITGSTAMKS